MITEPMQRAPYTSWLEVVNALTFLAEYYRKKGLVIQSEIILEMLQKSQALMAEVP